MQKKLKFKVKKYDPFVSLCNAWNIDDGLQALIDGPYFDGKKKHKLITKNIQLVH